MSGKIFHLAEIAMDENGDYVIQYFGEIAEQGGTALGYGNYVKLSLEGLLEAVKFEIGRNRQLHLDLLKKKLEKKEESNES